METEEIKIAFLDDEEESYEDYKLRLQPYGINLMLVENCVDPEDVLNWIIENRVELMLVDYKLSDKYGFNGVELVYYLNDKLPDLICVILTSHPKDSADEKLVSKNLIIDKKEMNKLDINEIVQNMKQSACVFCERLKRKTDKYNVLIEKKTISSLSSEEEEEFLFLYKLLRNYGEIDDLPAELLTTQLEKKVEGLLMKLDKIIKD